MALKPIPVTVPQWDEEKKRMSDAWHGYQLALEDTVNTDVAPAGATYIVKTSNSSLTAEQALSSLSTGFMKVTTGTGTITSSGSASIETTDIAGDAITNAKIADAQVSLEHLDSGITSSHVVKYAGTHTTAGGAASEDITVTGATGTDLAFVVIRTVGGTPRTLLTSLAGTNKITITFSGDPSTDHVVVYQILRAAS